MKTRLLLMLAALTMVAVLGAGLACSKSKSDAQIASEVQGKLMTDPAIASKQITVQATNGTVILAGTAASDAERNAAGVQASAVEGVKTVVNNIAVTPTQAAFQPPVAQSEPAPSATMTPAVVTRRQESKPAPSVHRYPTSSSASSPAPATAAAPVMAAAPQQAAPATPPPPPAPVKVTIQPGTSIAVRLVDGVDSETAQPGQAFRATLDAPLTADGEVVIPEGYDVRGHVVDVRSAGKFAGKSMLSLQLDQIQVGSKYYSISTNQFHREGSNRTTNTAAKVGTGAAIGAIIGGIAGGGKGAAIGAAAGGGLGGGVQAATKGQQIKLGSETILTFELQSPLTVVPAQGPNKGRPRLEQPSEQSQPQ